MRHLRTLPSARTASRLLVAAALLSLAAACERKSGGATDSGTGDIVIGMYGSLSGENASFGISSREGAELAVDEINASTDGVMNGRKFRMLVEDDQTKPEQASSAVTKLITQDKVVAVIGEVASSITLAAAPVAQRFKVPLITPASTNTKVTQVGDYIFRVCFIDPFQGEVLAKFAYNDLKARKVAILKDIGSDYSVGLTDSVSEHFAALGGTVLPPVSYSTADADFKAVLTQIRSQKPDAIFATGYYTQAAIIVRQARELGMNMPILGGDGWVGDALANGREALKNTYISNHYSGDNPSPIVQTFVAAYRKRFNREPDAIAALGYDAVKVLADAIRRAKSTDGTKVRDALASSDVAGVTGQLKMNAQRNVDKPAVVQELSYVDGKVKYNYKTTINPG
jgi:branched-chain amino acid transport system substrate-binding protein